MRKRSPQHDQPAILAAVETLFHLARQHRPDAVSEEQHSIRRDAQLRLQPLRGDELMEILTRLECRQRLRAVL